MENLNPNLNPNPNEALVSRPIKMRCPQCLKLYSVQPEEIRETRPKFECVSCHMRFWVPYPECLEQTEIIAFPLSWLSKAQTPEVTAVQAQPEAAVAGVTAPAKAVSTFSIGGSPEVKKLWEKVLNQYTEIPVHEDFLRVAQGSHELGFASQQYQKMLQVDPEDEIAKQMRDRIVALSLVTNGYGGKQLSEFVKTRLGITGVLMGAAIVVMLAGWVLPLLRNLVGVGAALFFFSLAIRLYLSRD